MASIRESLDRARRLTATGKITRGHLDMSKANQASGDDAATARRALPSVREVLESPILQRCLQRVPRRWVVDAVRKAVASTRKTMTTDGTASAPSAEALARSACEAVAGWEAARLRPVINATGILLHTGLGRAPLAASAVEAVRQVAAGYASIELDLTDGSRRDRTAVVGELLCELTGAESATVVNNNAAATLLALTAVAAAGPEGADQVIVSRGELIEIGGNFRLPDIMACGGTALREVGTSNRTTPVDYAEAVDDRTAALMKVHTSNYRVVGYTQNVSIESLVALGAEHGLPVIHDLGSGAVGPLPPTVAAQEPPVRDSVAAGCDLVLFSGDKLLGGPQAGIIVGRRAWVERLASHPMGRAMRVDKMTIAALEATLRLHHEPQRAANELPVLALLATPPPVLRRRAEAICQRLGPTHPTVTATAIDTDSEAGGGALPAHTIASAAVRLTSTSMSETTLAKRLRLGEPAVVGRITDGAVVLDLRTVLDTQDDALVQAITAASTPCKKT